MRFIDTDPTLSEFTAEELKVAAIAISIQIEETEKDIERVTKYPELMPMYADDLLRWRDRIANLSTVYTQLLNAAARKEMERRTICN